MAKQLYDYWFVQFDFPNEDGKPYKSSGGKMVWNETLKREIPEGWEVVKLKNLAETEKDQINPQSFPDVHFKHYSLPEYDKTGTYGVELGSEIQSNKFVISENSVMVSKLNPWTSRVMCGNNEENQIGSTEFVVLNPKDVRNKPFIYQLVKSEKFITYCTKGSTGTSHSHRRINPDLLVSFCFAYNKQIVDRYSQILSEYISLLQKNTLDIQMLIEQRDELLPLLMNGQVSVTQLNSDLSKPVEEHPNILYVYIFFQIPMYSEFFFYKIHLDWELIYIFAPLLKQHAWRYILSNT